MLGSIQYLQYTTEFNSLVQHYHEHWRSTSRHNIHLKVMPWCLPSTYHPQLTCRPPLLCMQPVWSGDYPTVPIIW